MFHNLKSVGNILCKRLLGLFKYIYDFKILLISISFIISSLIAHWVLRNTAVDLAMGWAISFFGLLTLYALVLFFTKYGKEVFKSGKRPPRGSSIFIPFLWDLLIVGIVVLSSASQAAHTINQERVLEQKLSSFTLGITEFEGYLVKESELKHGKQTLTASVLQGDGYIENYDKNILINLPRYYEFKIGQVCNFRGQLVEPENFEDFDYRSYLKSNNIFLIMDNPKFGCKDIKVERKGFFLRNILVDFKELLIKKVDKVLSEPQSSLLVGILFGQKRLFSSIFEEEVRMAGVSHVVAASGYNVSILIVAVEKLFLFLKKRPRIITSLIAIWGFTLLSGLSASIIRACIMSSLSLLSKFWGRGGSIHIALPLAAMIFLMFNPYIFSDVGFQLSLCATLGLVYISPILLSLKKKITKRIKIIDDYVITTMSCTISTLPISISTFSTFSIWSIPANTMILPIIESTMLWGLLSLIAGTIHQPLAYIFFTIVNIQLKYFQYIVELIGKLNFGSFEVSTDIANTISFTIFVITIIFSIILYPLENEKYNYYLKNNN